MTAAAAAAASQREAAGGLRATTKENALRRGRLQAGGVCEGRSGSLSMLGCPPSGMPRKGDLVVPLKGDRPEAPKSRRYNGLARRSGRVAEGGALLRRYGAEWLHRGFESLLLRWRGGRAVECGGLDNRYPSLGGSRVQIPPPPSHPDGRARRTFGTCRPIGVQKLNAN